MNTHPFVRRLWGRDWVFAHNGTLSGIMEEPDYRLKWCKPAGETDSEHAFCYILEKLASLHDRGLESLVVRLWSLAEEIGRYGKFNFLLSDGKYLYAYMNRRGTLHYLLRHPPHRGLIRLLNEDYEARLEELKASDEYAAIVATEPLTGEEWNPMNPGTLYVFYNGDLLLIVEKGNPKLALDGLEHEVLKIIRSAPHSVRLGDLAKELGLAVDEVSRITRRLRNKGLIRQHSRDNVSPDHPRVRYYTNPRIRTLIDKTISL